MGIVKTSGVFDGPTSLNRAAGYARRYFRLTR